MTVDDVMSRMTAKEYRGWEEHFIRFPHGDYHVQKLLAEILCFLIAAFSGKKLTIYDVAPHLEPPKMRHDRIKREQELIQSRKRELSKAVTDSYQELKKSGQPIHFEID